MNIVSETLKSPEAKRFLGFSKTFCLKGAISVYIRVLPMPFRTLAVYRKARYRKDIANFAGTQLWSDPKAFKAAGCC